MLLVSYPLDQKGGINKRSLSLSVGIFHPKRSHGLRHRGAHYYAGVLHVLHQLGIKKDGLGVLSTFCPCRWH